MNKFFTALFISLIALMVGIGVYNTWSIYTTSSISADTATSTVTVGNSAPSVSSVQLNSGSAINLTENSTTTVQCTATLTDANGYIDIQSATSTIYLKTTGSSCTADNNNCYQITSGSCSLGSGSGDDVPVTCSTDVWFHADPGAWDCSITAIDGSSATGTGVSADVTMNTLLALDVTSSIDYGTLNASTTMANLTKTSAVTNTGNAAIDVNLSGTDMISGTNTITVDNQRYATSSVAWASGIALSATATHLELPTNSKPTTHPSDVSDSVYWGINIPAGTTPGSYSGTNTFTAVAD